MADYKVMNTESSSIKSTIYELDSVGLLAFLVMYYIIGSPHPTPTQ